MLNDKLGLEKVVVEILIEMGVMGVEAVSYTHLDVYKRQEVNGLQHKSN